MSKQILEQACILSPICFLKSSRSHTHRTPPSSSHGLLAFDFSNKSVNIVGSWSASPFLLFVYCCQWMLNNKGPWATIQILKNRYQYNPRFSRIDINITPKKYAGTVRARGGKRESKRKKRRTRNGMSPRATSEITHIIIFFHFLPKLLGWLPWRDLPVLHCSSWKRTRHADRKVIENGFGGGKVPFQNNQQRSLGHTLPLQTILNTLVLNKHRKVQERRRAKASVKTLPLNISLAVQR